MSLLVVVLFVLGYVHAEYRIIGGEDTTIEQFPHQAALEWMGKYMAGGAIIGPTKILTAAHIKYGMPPNLIIPYLSVRVGSTQREKGGKLHIVLFFGTFVKPENKVTNGDVGVVSLVEPIKFGPTVQPIALVPEGKYPVRGDIFTATGWGATKKGEDDHFELQTVRLPFIEQPICNASWFNLKGRQIQNHMFCAGGGQTKTTYIGDSGGPLINERKELVGIVSWGPNNLHPGYPAVFVNIASPEIQHYIRSRLKQ